MYNDYYRPSRFQILPPVVKNLLIINGIMYLASVVLKNSMGIDLERMLGLYFFQSPLFKPFQIFTHLFMHGSFWHVASNMLSLWMFGNMLENYWGGPKFLIYYLITGLGAAFIHQTYQYYEIGNIAEAAAAFADHPTVEGLQAFTARYVPLNNAEGFQRAITIWMDNPMQKDIGPQLANDLNEYTRLRLSVPTVGASGAVFGVLLAFGMLFPNTLVFFLPIKAKYLVILYGIAELSAGLENTPGDNVAHFAHLGGMLFGFILIKVWQRNNFRPY